MREAPLRTISLPPTSEQGRSRKVGGRRGLTPRARFGIIGVEADLGAAGWEQEVPVKRLVEFPLESGGSIWVEVEEEPTPGPMPAGRGAPEKAKESFEQAWEAVRPIATTIIGKLRALHDPPDEVKVEFGLKMNTEAGLFLAAAGLEAHYKVTLTWKRGKEG